MAKFVNCWRGLPYVVNRGGQKNFTQFMSYIKTEFGELPEGWEPSPDEFKRYIGRAILYRDIQRIVKADEAITSHRVNITNYVVSLLAEKTARRIDLDATWKCQRISDAFVQTARNWAPVVYKALRDFFQSRNEHPDNVVKSEAAWKHILSLDLTIPTSVSRELVATGIVVGETGGSAGPEGENNIARCQEIKAQQWLEALTWARQSGQFSELTLRVAGTLAGYAAQGWENPPSPKQAKHGAAIIEAARSAGILTH